MKIGTKVRIKGNKEWGGFRGEIIDISESKKTVLVVIRALGEYFHLKFKFGELEEA